jgi:TonB family protein
MFVVWLCASGVTSLTVMHTLPATTIERSLQRGRVRTNDESLRKLAIVSPAPTYPSGSLAKKAAGVVVAAILIDPKGTTQAVEILQSVDAEIGRAVHDALMQWTFRPLEREAEGIVVFYFHIKGQAGVVSSPAEMREVTNPAAKNVKREDETPAKPISEAELRTISTKPGPLLLDIRDRETFAERHEKGALNIPLKELLARGPAEIQASRHVVIDCLDAPDFCSVAAHFLTSSGFKQVSILRR